MPTDTFFNLSKEKRNRIINATIKEFSDNTYEKTSINRIIEDANIPKGSFYQYFDNKDDLYFYCLNKIYKKAVEAIYLGDLERSESPLNIGATLCQNEELILHEKLYISVIGEKNYKFITSILSAPKHIQSAFSLNLATSWLQPILLKNLEQDRIIENKSHLDFFAFLLSISSFLITEYGSLKDLSLKEKEQYSLLYINTIMQALTKKSRQEPKSY